MLQPRIWLLGLFPFRPIIPIGCRPAPAECGLDRPATRATDRRRARCVVTIGHPTGGCRRSPRTSTARLANRFRATRLARNSPIGNPQTDSNVRLYPLDHCHLRRLPAAEPAVEFEARGWHQQSVQGCDAKIAPNASQRIGSPCSRSAIG